ncbi:glycosyltransferase family 4 protein [Yersinia mollaretii]|uniref:glycosyltransferase family 4 protein n=1 Tax=Yersinia mollaretii TaxID=33060 RepID=UPI001427B1C3|nr:glycosyltransferase family 1 protein [Yersinia mollaretii]MDA5534844.1 glycosyltransferase family 1 protein [Yersinia mollaretii]NIL02762.1 glycosyltransferase family 4 protein [Yersinia mollaretii]
MSSIWMDVTSISTWNRPAVGIIRVEAECAKYAIGEISDDIKFCVYDPQNGYSEVSRDTVNSYFINFTKRQKKSILVDDISKVGFEQRLKALFLKYNSKLPRSISSSLYSFLVSRKNAFGYFLSSARHLKAGLKELFAKHGKNSSNLKVKANKLVRKSPFAKNDIYLSLGLDWDQKDLNFLYSLKKEFSLKVILFCYDVIPVKLPHLCVGNVSAAFRHYFSNVAWCADKILCISDCSRKDLRELLVEMGPPIPELSVIQLGCDLPNLKNNEVVELPVDLKNSEYILFVSTIERRKNHETLYKAYINLIEEKCEDLPMLVFVGMAGWGVHDFLQDISLDPRVKNKIKIYNNIEDSMLSFLYRNCLFTVYPSLYEGWGLPISESLAYGKFCLASKAASIPEAGGDFIEYIYPWDVIGWAETLKKYIYSKELLIDKENKIKHFYKVNSWNSSAKTIFEHVKAINK